MSKFIFIIIAKYSLTFKTKQFWDLLLFISTWTIGNNEQGHGTEAKQIITNLSLLLLHRIQQKKSSKKWVRKCSTFVVVKVQLETDIVTCFLNFLPPLILFSSWGKRSFWRVFLNLLLLLWTECKELCCCMRERCKKKENNNSRTKRNEIEKEREETGLKKDMKDEVNKSKQEIVWEKEKKMASKQMNGRKDTTTDGRQRRRRRN